MRKLGLALAALACLVPVTAGAAEPRPRLSYPYELYVVSRTGDSVRQITDDGIDQYESVWSPGGAMIASEISVGRHSKVEVRSASGRLLHRYGAGELGGRPSWSPDGERIAYIRSYENPVRSAVDGELVVRRVDGGAPNAIASLASERPAWAPEGGSLFYVRGEDLISVGGETPPSDPAIWNVGVDGSNPHEVVPKAVPTAPFVSPNGRRILFHRFLPRYRMAVMTARLDGGDQRQLKAGEFQPTASWVPGSRDVWMFVPSGPGYGYPVRLGARGRDTRLPRRIDVPAAWSPDGKWIAYVRDDRVERIRPDGSGRELLLRFKLPRNAPGSAYVQCGTMEWAPDSSRFLLACGTDYID